MHKNVLIFPAGTEIGLEIYRSLKYSTHFTVYGGSSVIDHATLVYEKDKIISNLPTVYDSDLGKKLNEYIDKNKIDCIIPAHDEATVILSELEENGTLHCKVLGPGSKLTKIARSKRQTYKELEKEINVPKIYKLEEVTEDHLPLFLKPDKGQGSKGVHLVKSLQELKLATSVRNDDYLICEYLPGSEFTIDVLSTEEEVLFIGPRKRSRITNGISVKTEIIENTHEITNIVNAIHSKFRLRGGWFVQVKENSNGKLTILELSTRIAGSSGIHRLNGINLSLLSLFIHYGVDINLHNAKITNYIDRSLDIKTAMVADFESVYVDFDDTLIIEDKINSQLIAFLYECINLHKELVLITRYKGNIHHELKKRKLDNLFHRVIHLDKESKHTYFNEKKSIFIDDSYAERVSVAKNPNVISLDVHAIEGIVLVS